MMQYSCLLELTAEMEPLFAKEKNEQNKISGCQADLWIVLSFSNDLIHVRAGSDSLIVKGIVAVIVALFDKRTPQEICGAHIDFPEKTPLKEQISTDRYQKDSGLQHFSHTDVNHVCRINGKHAYTACTGQKLLSPYKDHNVETDCY